MNAWDFGTWVPSHSTRSVCVQEQCRGEWKVPASVRMKWILNHRMSHYAGRVSHLAFCISSQFVHPQKSFGMNNFIPISNTSHSHASPIINFISLFIEWVDLLILLARTEHSLRLATRIVTAQHSHRRQKCIKIIYKLLSNETFPHFLSRGPWFLVWLAATLESVVNGHHNLWAE